LAVQPAFVMGLELSFNPLPYFLISLKAPGTFYYVIQTWTFVPSHGSVT
jgi:hypothetical protein